MEETTYIPEVEQQEPDQQPDPKPKKVKVKEFAAKIKAKYPDYKDVDDLELTQKIIAKYPEYKDQVDLTPEKKKPTSSISFEESSLQAGDALSQSNGVGGEQIPTIEMYTTPNGEMVEANPIALSRKFNELSTRTKEVSVPASGKGGQILTTTPDEDAKKAAKKLKEDFPDLDLQGINDELKDVPDEVLQRVGNELLEDRKNNNPLYQRKLANIKWRNEFENKILDDVDKGNISPDNYNRLKEGIDMLPQFTGSGDFSNQRGAVKSLAQDIQLYGGENRDKILENFAVEVSKVYGSAYRNNFDNTIKDTPEGKYLNADEQLALQYLKDVAPDKAGQYDRLMVDPATLKDNPDALKGYNHLKQTLEETGIGLQQNAVTEELNNLKSIANKYGGLTEEQLAKATELEKKQEELTEKQNELDTKYPDRIEDKVDDALQEIMGQKTSGLFGMNYVGGTAFKAIKNTGKGIWEAVSTPFMSDASNTLRELSIMGDNLEDNRIYHKTDKNQALLTDKMVIEPELQTQIDAIKNNKVMTESQKEMKIYQLLRQNTDKFGRVPIKGGKWNLNGASIAYGLSDLGTTLLPFVALETVTGGGATAGLVRKFMTTFTAAAATSFHDEYASALLSGKSQSEAYKEAMGMTAISSLAMAGAATPSKIKAMVNPKTSAGKLILSMSDDAIQKVLDRGGNKALNAIKGRLKATPEMVKGGLKTGAEFEVAMTAANELKHQIYDTEIDREANFKHSLLAIGNFGIMGASLGQYGYKSPTQMQKGAGLMFGAKPKDYISVAEQMRKDGQLTETEFNHRVELINQFGDAYKSIPKDLPENKKAEYLYQTVIKNEANKGKSDLPPKQAAEAEKTALVADHTRGLILDPQTDKQLNDRKGVLERKLEPKKDAEGKDIELPEKEKLDLQAELEAVTNELETRKSFEKTEMKRREFVDTKLSQPLEGRDEQGVPIGKDVPPPTKIETKEEANIGYEDLPQNVKDIVDKYGDANDKTEFNKKLEEAGYETDYDFESFGIEDGVTFRKIEKPNVVGDVVVDTWKPGDLLPAEYPRQEKTIKTIVKEMSGGMLKVEFDDGSTGMISKDKTGLLKQLSDATNKKEVKKESEQNSLKDTFDKYEEGTISTFDDLVNEVEAYADTNGNTNLLNAVEKYRKEKQYDKEFLGERGDWDAMEADLTNAIKSEIKKQQSLSKEQPSLSNVVVDDKGVPVNEGSWYHGSPTEGLSGKDLKPNDKGLIFFTRDKNIAERYSTNDYEGNTPSNNVFERKLEVNKIFDPEKNSGNPEIIDLLASKGNFENAGRNADFDALAKEALENGEWSNLETKEFIDGLKKLGYDAIYIDNRPYYSENAEGKRTFSRDIAVFDTKQHKEQSLSKEQPKEQTPTASDVESTAKALEDYDKKIKPTGIPLSEMDKRDFENWVGSENIVDGKIKVYRGTKVNGAGLRKGDFVTTDKEYAKTYGENVTEHEIPTDQLNYFSGVKGGDAKQVGEGLGRKAQPTELVYSGKSESLLSKEQTQPSIKQEVVEEKAFTKNALDRADAKKIFAQVREVDTPTSAEQVALEYIANGGKVSEAAINEVAGTVKRASLNTGARELKSSEAKSRDYSDKKAETLDELAHNLWELNGQRIPETEIKDALMDVIRTHNTRLDAGKAYLEQYSAEYNEKKQQEKFYQEHLKEIEDDIAFLTKEADLEKEAMADENYVTNLIEKYETESKGQNQQPATETKGSINEGVGNKESIGQKEEKIKNEEPKATEIPNKKEGDSTPKPEISEATLTAGEGKEGGKKPPPIEPTETVGEGGNGKLNDKGILNRLYKAKNLPEQTKKGLEEQGLKYKVATREEAKAVAKSVIEEFGIDEAVILAEANKFKGGANSAIFAESINMLAEMEAKSTNPKEKTELSQKSKELLTRYDELSRDKGQDISYIDEFYKKSPLGVVLKESATKKENFEQWAKSKDKSWKEAFDEMLKEPEFEKEVNEKVKEEMRKERAEARTARIKKVDEFFDKAKDQFKGGAAYSTVIPPQVITAALEGMKKAYHAGEKVAKIIQDAVDYISEKLGNETWDKEKFRKEWEEKLQDKPEKKKLTDEETKARILDRFRNKLKGLSNKEKEEVVLRSFKKIVEAGGLKYDEFRNIIAEVTGRSELTEAEANAIKKLVEQTNKVDEAGKRARELKTDRALNAYKLTQIKAAQAQRELNTIIYSKPNILKRITSLVQLNTLGATSLVVNIAYNLVNHVGIRFPVGVVKTAVDAILPLINKKYKPETNVFSLNTQKEFFSKLWLGGKEAVNQFATGLNRMDYIQKELYGQQIRPLTSIKELWEASTGKRKLTSAQIFDKLLQALPFGWSAEGVARSLNIGDKPMRFAADGAQQAVFAKSLGLKDINYKLFIEFPREIAYQVYKDKGFTDTEAAKKADYVRDTIEKEGARSTFQQDNFLNDILGNVFGGQNSGLGGLIKTVTVSPYIKIPSNAYWSYFNIVNPEVALLQSMIYGAKAYAKRNGTKTFSFDKSNSTAEKDVNEAKYWLGHAIVGYSTRAVIASLVAAGVYRSSNTQDDTKKEREGEQNFEAQGTMNLTKLNAWIKGEDPNKIKGGYVISNKWFGHFGSVGNTMAKIEEELTPEQKANRDNYLDEMLGNMNASALPALEQGIFSNSASLLTALDRGGFDAQRYGVSMVNMFVNTVQPATFAQVSKAQLPYYTKTKADTFGAELKNALLTRSSWLRKLSGQYPPSKVSIWGDKIPKEGNIIEKLFGFSRANDDNFAQPIYEDYKKTDNTAFFPPAVKSEITVDGKKEKLNTSQVSELEEMIGRNRKALIAPFINGYATYDGYSYKELKTEESKIAALKIIYDLGREKGEDEFTAKYPKYENQETGKSEERLERERLNKEFKESLKNE